MKTEKHSKMFLFSPLLFSCVIGKNGVYINLVQQVQEAFEACELVRINCKDMDRSDCRKIGAKLKVSKNFVVEITSSHFCKLLYFLIFRIWFPVF